LKEKAVRRLTRAAIDSLQLFDPAHGRVFVCPVCLDRIPETDSGRISKAHILPKAAGGNIFTLLCRVRCNNTFGKYQDKWLGEHLNVVRSPFGLFQSKAQDGRFEVDGHAVNGWFKVSDDGYVDFVVPDTSNRPDVLQSFTEHFRTRRRSINIRFGLPLLDQQVAVDIGFLTAAYLLWFRALGYSWALQRHLEPVRQQLLRPTDSVLPRAFAARSHQWFDAPCLGVGHLPDKSLVLYAGIADRLVLLPPADEPDVYTRLLKIKGDSRLDYQNLEFDWPNGFRGPTVVAHSERMVVVPDAWTEGRCGADMSYFPPGEDSATLIPLRQVSAVQAEAFRASPQMPRFRVRREPDDSVDDEG
jgi:hypothetical protein